MLLFDDLLAIVVVDAANTAARTSTAMSFRLRSLSATPSLSSHSARGAVAAASMTQR